jgi:hypothetical protein
MRLAVQIAEGKVWNNEVLQLDVEAIDQDKESHLGQPLVGFESTSLEPAARS